MIDDAALFELLGRRRDRVIAIILGFKERECDGFLPAASSQKLRKVVLDQLNEFCDTACDLLRSVSAGGSGVVMNDLYLERLDEMRSQLTILSRAVLETEPVSG